MTRKLENLFNLPQEEKKESNSVEPEHDNQDNETYDDYQMTLSNSLEELDKIEQALPAVRGLEMSDKEMDELSGKASASFDDLMDLGMNVDSRYSADIFSVASTMLGHALTAKNAKINKKLKMIDLQLKKMRLDQDQTKKKLGEEMLESQDGVVIDRNQLLNELLNKSKTNSDGNSKD